MTQLVSKAVGIDLGTTNSAVAMMNPTDTGVLIHRDAKTRSRTTPSCVWRNPADGELVVGKKAFARLGGTPEPVRSIKRQMGQRSTVSVSGREMSPEEVSAAILSEMKRQIEQDAAGLATADTSWLVDRAIVTVPAYFNQPQIDATRKAGELAGLEVLDLLHEPTAAACYHCWRTGTRDGTFLVYDLGGGTFDVTVLRCTAGVYEVLGISGNNRLGGDDIDAALAGRLREMLEAEDWALDLDPGGDPEDRLRFSQLKLLAEGVKKALSQSSEYVLRDTGTITDKEGNRVIIEAEFERADLDAVARPHVERTLTYCQEALDQAGREGKVALGDIDQVILVGGMTHMPLVRELVTRELCAGARCEEPVYEEVDTVVAQGAAVRAAVTGGLAVYDPGRTVRVSFRGTAASAATSTHIGGTVQALAGDLRLAGGLVRLETPDGDVDESEIGQTGAFSFTRVPLTPGAETNLSFEIFDDAGERRAAIGRPITHSPDADRLPGPSNVSVASKSILLEVKRGGRLYRRELIPALQELPASAEHTFTHPGDTETVIFPLYQQSKKIEVITVPVPSSTPRGTPIRFEMNMDRHSFITVHGTIGEVPFEAAVEVPADREMPTEDEVAELEQNFRQAVESLSPGERNTAQIKHAMVMEAIQKARQSGDRDQAVHEVEEIEELIAKLGEGKGTLEPPKPEFDRLVEDCTELNAYVGQLGAGRHDQQETAQSIEVQRAAGERAYQAADQNSYGEAIRQLTAYREHLVGLARQARPRREPTEAERAAAIVSVALKEADKVRQLAQAASRADLLDEIGTIQGQLQELSGQFERDPGRVQERGMALRARLEQLDNVLSQAPGSIGSHVLDHSGNQGPR